MVLRQLDIHMRKNEVCRLEGIYVNLVFLLSFSVYLKQL